MGLTFTKLFSRLFAKKEMCILMVSLDTAGKLQFCTSSSLGRLSPRFSPLASMLRLFEYKNISFTVWDVGGQNKIRPLWRHYFQNTQGLIFVVDSNDRDMCYIQSTCATSGKGLYEGLDLLANNIANKA